MIMFSFIEPFLMAGVNITKYDKESKTLYLDMPKHSYAYEMEKGFEICNAEEYAKYLNKEIQKYLSGLKIKFKERDEVWTKEMGEENCKNRDAIYKGILQKLSE